MDFCLRIDGVQPQKSQSDAARLKTASQKENTSLKARKARDFKGKGVLLRAFALTPTVLLSTQIQKLCDLPCCLACLAWLYLVCLSGSLIPWCRLTKDDA